jgi:hypothetical protein
MHPLGEFRRILYRGSSENSPSSTTSLDRCSALESRLIRRKWSRILRLFESESDKIGAQRPAFAFQEPLYAGFSAGSPVLNEVVLGTRVNSMKKGRSV